MYEQFTKCQYPNMAAEIYINQANNPCARLANITKELLEAFLEGKEEITLDEALGIIRYFNNTDDVYRSASYMLSPKFSYYDTKNKKHFRKIFSIFKQCDDIRKAEKIKQLANEGKLSKFEADLLLYREENLVQSKDILDYDYICIARVNRYKKFLAKVDKAEQRIVPQLRGASKTPKIEYTPKTQEQHKLEVEASHMFSELGTNFLKMNMKQKQDLVRYSNNLLLERAE